VFCCAFVTLSFRAAFTCMEIFAYGLRCHVAGRGVAPLLSVLCVERVGFLPPRSKWCPCDRYLLKDSRIHLRPLSVGCGVAMVCGSLSPLSISIISSRCSSARVWGGVLWCLFTIIHYVCCWSMCCMCGWGRYYCSVCLLSRRQYVLTWFLSNWAVVV
jgi:hypothetical protein